MKTAAVVYLTHPLAFEYLGGQSIGEAFIRVLQEVRNLCGITVVIPAVAKYDPRPLVDELGVAGRVFHDMKWDTEPALTDQHCIDAWSYSLDGETLGAEAVVACVPYFPFLSAPKIELCIRKLGRASLWTGPCRTLPATVINMKGGMRRVDVAGYIGGVRVFKAGLRNEPKPWDNVFGGVECDAIEALNIALPAERKLAEALLAG
jgi:hypothetical protein